MKIAIKADQDPGKQSELLSNKGIVEGPEQSDEEAAPAHDPNLKHSKAPERYAPGPAVIFYGKKSCFPGRCGAILFHSLPVQ
jgi:hypothetical protein